MSTPIAAALALGGALRIALFGMRFVQSCVRFRFLWLFFVLMARARTADSVRGRVLLWHWRASFLKFFDHPSLSWVALLHKLVELHCRCRAFKTTRVSHDLFMSLTAKVSINIGFRCPFRIRDELMCISAAKQLFRDTPLLLNHQGRTFLLPYIERLLNLGWIDSDMDQPDYGHCALFVMRPPQL